MSAPAKRLIGPHGECDRAAELSLLRAYEPVLRYTQGELFFPTEVGPYVARCSLLARTPTGASELIVAAPELTLDASVTKAASIKTGASTCGSSNSRSAGRSTGVGGAVHATD